MSENEVNQQDEELAKRNAEKEADAEYIAHLEKEYDNYCDERVKEGKSDPRAVAYTLKNIRHYIEKLEEEIHMLEEIIK